MSSIAVHPVGTRALVVDLPDLETVMSWHAALTASPLSGQSSVVAAARTVLVQFATPSAADDATAVLQNFRPDAATAKSPRDITVDVLYDGDDLDEAASTLGFSTDSLIDWHTSTTWVAAFGGFAPGFTYCVAQDASLSHSVPRRASPRTTVPTGSVGLAGEFSAVYPRSSPGGWQLIGTTATRFWDAQSDEPALLNPGDRVRYRPVREHVDVVSPTADDSSTSPDGEEASLRAVLRIDEPGLQTLIEDLGRPGFGDLGVTTSGAADRASSRAANDAVGNPHTAAVLENIGGLSLSALEDTVVAVAGASAPVTVSGTAPARHVDPATPVLLPVGSRLTVGAATNGLRSYVAVRGGVAATSVLGSRSSDLMSGLGPAPLQAGDTIRTLPARGVVPPPGPVTDRDDSDSNDGADEDERTSVLHIIAGPRDNWFDDGAAALTKRTWEVSGTSNRVGVRLSGDAILRTDNTEIPSEGMVAGSIQVPPDGQPVLFLRDHAVTGGYPVIATVIPENLDRAAQLAPGTTVTFKELT